MRFLWLRNGVFVLVILYFKAERIVYLLKCIKYGKMEWYVVMTKCLIYLSALT